MAASCFSQASAANLQVACTGSLVAVIWLSSCMSLPNYQTGLLTRCSLAGMQSPLLWQRTGVHSTAVPCCSTRACEGQGRGGRQGHDGAWREPGALSARLPAVYPDPMPAWGSRPSARPTTPAPHRCSLLVSSPCPTWMARGRRTMGEHAYPVAGRSSVRCCWCERNQQACSACKLKVLRCAGSTRWG